MRRHQSRRPVFFFFFFFEGWGGGATWRLRQAYVADADHRRWWRDRSLSSTIAIRHRGSGGDVARVDENEGTPALARVTKSGQIARSSS